MNKLLIASFAMAAFLGTSVVIAKGQEYVPWYKLQAAKQQQMEEQHLVMAKCNCCDKKSRHKDK